MQTEANMPTFNDGDRTTENKSFTCEGCGKAYEKAILASIVFQGQTQEYYACPRCMTKTPPTQKQKNIQEPNPPTTTVQEKKTASVEKETIPGCTHHLGYLKKREKDKPFPDECLTCSKMVDCMMK